MSKFSNSLAVLHENYGSDSDDFEYEENSFTDCKKGETRNENRFKLPLPEAVINLYQENVLKNHIDSPDLHGGRIRSFPHERGNWATCVFVPYENSEFVIPISNLLAQVCGKVSDFHVCMDFHISLSRTVSIQYHWIEPLIDEVRKRIKTVNRFLLDFDDVEVYTNDESTRTFVGLKVSLGYNDLGKCVRCVDSSFSEFHLPSYYEDPSFHMSLIWCLGDKKVELQSLLPTLKNHFLLYQTHHADLKLENVTRICCKIGNRVYNFELLS